MVNGIESFRDHFKDYLDRFVIVGGVACYIIHKSAGLEFRATKDFDIVIIADKVDREFSDIIMVLFSRPIQQRFLSASLFVPINQPS